MAGGISGAYGASVPITGTNLGTHSTQVRFGSQLATTTCANSTSCTAIAPQNTGVVPVTLSDNGTTINLGNYSYLGTPNCQFSATDVSTSAVWATCAINAAKDPIWIFEPNSAGTWQMVFNYPVTGSTKDLILSGVTPGSTIDLVGCTETEDGYLNSEPGAPGCDNVATAVTIPKSYCSGPGCVHIYTAQ